MSHRLGAHFGFDAALESVDSEDFVEVEGRKLFYQEHGDASDPTAVFFHGALRTGMPHPEIPDFESLASHGGPADRPFSGRLAYVNSKLCNLWFTYELVRRLEAAGIGRGDRPLSVNHLERARA